MTTVADLVLATKNHLTGGYKTTLDELAVSCDGSQTTVTLTWTQTLRPGSVLSIGSEDLLVRSYNAGTKVATVRRGWRGSVATAHGQYDEVEVNPRFPSGMVAAELLNEIRSWPTNLFRPDKVTATLAETWTGYYTLGAGYDDVVALLDVGWKADANDLVWHWMAYPRLRLDTNLNPIVEFGELLNPGDILMVLGRQFNLDTFTDATNVVTTCGLQQSMVDIPPLGAAIRLMGYSEIQRTDRQAQGEPRIAAESPAGHAIQTAVGLERMRQRRLGEEAQRLRERFRMRSW